MKQLASSGVGPEGKILFPWYERSLTAGAQGDKTTIAEVLQTNVMKLCGLPDWDGVCKVQSWLGGSYDKVLHQEPPRAPSTRSSRLENPPSNSPFSSGGSVVLHGPAGLGKIELAQHVVVYAAQKYFMMPVIGTMGPRTQDLARMGAELVRSCLGAYRHAVDPSLPDDEGQALSKLLPHLESADNLPDLLRDAYEGGVHEDTRTWAQLLCDGIEKPRAT